MRTRFTLTHYAVFTAVAAALFALASVAMRHVKSRLGRRSPTYFADIMPAVFSADGSRMATGLTYYESWKAQYGVEVVLWDAAKGAVVKRSTTYGGLRAVALSGDGRLVATSEASRVRLWRASQEFEWIPTCATYTDTIAFGKNDSLLVLGTSDGVEIWEVAPLRHVATLPPKWVRASLFSPDGSTLLTMEAMEARGAQKEAVLWDVESRLEKCRFAIERRLPFLGVAAAFAQKVPLVAIATGSGTVEVLDWISCERQRVISVDASRVFLLALSSDGQTLVVYGCDPENDPTTRTVGDVVIYNVKSRKQTGRLIGHSDRIYGMSFLGDGKVLSTASYDGTIRLWDVEKLESIAVHTTDVHRFAKK